MILRPGSAAVNDEFSAVVLPRPQLSLSAAPVATAIDDVYVRGTDVVIIEQGRRPPSSDERGAGIDLGPLGRGRLVLSTIASAVTARLPGGAYVEVRGTVPPATLPIQDRPR